MTRHRGLDRCGYCSKLTYRNRKAAQRAAKIIPGTHMTAYRCAGGPAGYDAWHLGHMPRAVVHGERDKAGFVEHVTHRDGRAS